jgi:hypothetical protein
MIEPGDRVKDKVSGFTGICTARYEFLNRCVRIEVSPEGLDKDGNPAPGKVFDEHSLEVVARGVVARPPASIPDPHPTPKQQGRKTGTGGPTSSEPVRR